MKKGFKLLMAAVLSFVLVGNVANASDLSATVNTGDGNLAGISSAVTFDSTDEVTKVLFTITADTEGINTVLSQKSGIGSFLSTFYFEVDPGFTGTYYKKAVVWYGPGLNNETIAEAKTTLANNIASETISPDRRVWPNGLSVEYYDGSTWKLSSNQGDLTKTIKSDLLNVLGITENELEYGTNFRFSMYDEYGQLWAWQEVDAAGNPIGDGDIEYIAVDYEIKFPISGKSGNSQILFETLDDALASGSTTVYVNEDLTYDDNLTVPQGVELVVAEDVELVVTDGHTVTVEGTTSGDILAYHEVAIAITENGRVTTDKQSALKGEEVTIIIEPDDGYVVDEINVVDAGGNGLTVTDSTFVMPDSVAGVIVTFKEEVYNVMVEEVENGTVEIDKETAKPGDTVTVTVEADKDYIVKKIEFVDEAGKATIVKNGKFVMPESDVTVVVTFEEEPNPDTSDNVMLYFVLAIASLGALLVSAKQVKRYNN